MKLIKSISKLILIGMLSVSAIGQDNQLIDQKIKKYIHKYIKDTNDIEEYSSSDEIKEIYSYSKFIQDSIDSIQVKLYDKMMASLKDSLSQGDFLKYNDSIQGNLDKLSESKKEVSGYVKEIQFLVLKPYYYSDDRYYQYKCRFKFDLDLNITEVRTKKKDDYDKIRND